MSISDYFIISTKKNPQFSIQIKCCTVLPTYSILLFSLYPLVCCNFCRNIFFHLLLTKSICCDSSVVCDRYEIKISTNAPAVLGSKIQFHADLYEDGQLRDGHYIFNWKDNSIPQHTYVSTSRSFSLLQILLEFRSSLFKIVCIFLRITYIYTQKLLIHAKYLLTLSGIRLSVVRVANEMNQFFFIMNFTVL